ncbi:MAG: putative protein YbaA [Phycisphaerae bacterium]|nr:putative protein YbaA [Phycisphaerae bacterium]
MSYVDGFVIPLPKKNIAAYRRLARKAGVLWKEHGALDYRECVADDLQMKIGIPFKKLLKLKAGETVLFSWILYKSRAHRDRVNKLVMKDPRLTKMVEAQAMPFDCRRMTYGGFKTLVNI